MLSSFVSFILVRFAREVCCIFAVSSILDPIFLFNSSRVCISIDDSSILSSLNSFELFFDFLFDKSKIIDITNNTVIIIKKINVKSIYIPLF